jgi:hypothetical protein
MLYPYLFEELLISSGSAYVDVAAFSAEIQNLDIQRVIAARKLSYKTHSSSLNSNFHRSIHCQKLVEPQFFPSIFSQDIPVLNNIYHFVVTFQPLQAENKNHLSPQRRHVFVTPRKDTSPKTDISPLQVKKRDYAQFKKSLRIVFYLKHIQKFSKFC